MRRLIWTCVAVMLAGACWLYVAAMYVASYPDSNLTRCAAVAYRMGTECNPMYRVSAAVAVRVRRAVQSALSQPAYRTEAVAVGAACGAVVAQSEPAIAERNLYRTEIIPPVCDPASPTEEVQGQADNTWIKFEDAEDGKVRPIYFDPAEESAAPPAAAPADNDGDNGPDTMPTLPEDEAKPEDPPATMPYIDDDDNALLEYWKSLFIEQADANAQQSSTEDGKQTSSEESENVPQADSNEYQMPPSHYSSHPTSYPGCERTVTCPYTGRTYPADPAQDDPQPTTQPKKKKKKDANTGKANGNQPGTISRILQEQKGTEDVPVHPEVDTTEFRRNDAKKGEFDPMPE
jgi:hypothetical protein